MLSVNNLVLKKELIQSISYYKILQELSDRDGESFVEENVVSIYTVHLKGYAGTDFYGHDFIRQYFYFAVIFLKHSETINSFYYDSVNSNT